MLTATLGQMFKTSTPKELGEIIQKLQSESKEDTLKRIESSVVDKQKKELERKARIRIAAERHLGKLEGRVSTTGIKPIKKLGKN